LRFPNIVTDIRRDCKKISKFELDSVIPESVLGLSHDFQCIPTILKLISFSQVSNYRRAKLLQSQVNSSHHNSYTSNSQPFTPTITMGTPSWAIPVGVLGGLCLACLAFIWWYIPRLYTRGIQADINRVAVEKAERERNAATLPEANGEDTDLEAGGATVLRPVVKEFKYTPAAYTAY
jgi:hypothetical protein